MINNIIYINIYLCIRSNVTAFSFWIVAKSGRTRFALRNYWFLI